MADFEIPGEIVVHGQDGRPRMTLTGGAMSITPTQPRLRADGDPTVQRVLAQVRARLVARYKLHQNGPKPHELVRGDGLGVSTGYCGGEVRFRLMRDGEWVQQFDVPLGKVIPTNRAHRFDLGTQMRLDRHFQMNLPIENEAA